MKKLHVITNSVILLAVGFIAIPVQSGFMSQGRSDADKPRHERQGHEKHEFNFEGLEEKLQKLRDNKDEIISKLNTKINEIGTKNKGLADKLQKAKSKIEQITASPEFKNFQTQVRDLVDQIKQAKSEDSTGELTKGSIFNR